MVYRSLPAVLILACAATGAQAALPLKTGAYVRDGVQCSDAPLAAELRYDGKSFLGPHESDCTTTLLRHTGRRYDLRSTCRAAGDGSPTPPYAELQSVVVLSRARFTFNHRTGAGRIDTAGYRLCRAVP